LHSIASTERGFEGVAFRMEEDSIEFNLKINRSKGSVIISSSKLNKENCTIVMSSLVFLAGMEPKVKL
jgi:hypothetical protein